MTDRATLDAAVGGIHLTVAALVPTTSEDLCGKGTVALLSPDGAAFWKAFQGSDAYCDGRPNPMDRWSQHHIDAVACNLGATTIYPSDGPPYPPFIAWALRSGAIWASPIGLLISAEAGLWVSFRGALHFPHAFAPGPLAQSPCLSCQTKPCLTACPVAALGAAKAYDVPACHAHLDTPAGADCMTLGCRARRFCPVSARADRASDQSAFHMKAFHR